MDENRLALGPDNIPPCAVWLVKFDRPMTDALYAQ
jgi:hypothetical protein